MEDIASVILTICGLITSLAAATAVIVKVVVGTVKKIASETIREEMSRHETVAQGSFKGIEEEIKILNNRLLEFHDEQKDVNDTLKESLLASTRDRINQAHDFYCKRKFIGAHALCVLEDLYSSYRRLGGNSFIKRQMEDLRGLQVLSAEVVDENENND